jgi:hypothetical protein
MLTACSSGDGAETASGHPSVVVPSDADNTGLVYVSLGDSWPEGAHCDGCRTFPQIQAEALEQTLGRPITLKDLAGQAQPYFESLGGGTASLLKAIEADEVFRGEVASGDVIVIATGPNEADQAFEAIQDGTCGGKDDTACVDELGRTWERNFDAILDEIETLRDERPTAIRLVNAAILIDPSSSPEVARGIAVIFETLTQVLCDSAEAHGAVCVDVRPVLNGPDLNQPVNDSSQESMDAVAELLVETGVPELE